MTARRLPGPRMPASSVRKAAPTIRELPPAAAMTLINRDYHPGSTVRPRRRLTAIADWAQASSAPPDPDAGTCGGTWPPITASRPPAGSLAAIGSALDGQPYRDLVGPLPDIGDSGDIMQPACSASACAVLDGSSGPAAASSTGPGRSGLARGP